MIVKVIVVVIVSVVVTVVIIIMIFVDAVDFFQSIPKKWPSY